MNHNDSLKLEFLYTLFNCITYSQMDDFKRKGSYSQMQVINPKLARQNTPTHLTPDTSYMIPVPVNTYAASPAEGTDSYRVLTATIDGVTYHSEL